MDRGTTDASPQRTLYGNLFVESTWARLDAAARRDRGRRALSPLDPRFQPPDDVLHRISALGTLLRAVARPGDRLWLPKLVDPARMTDVPSLARPEIFTGARGTPRESDLSWGDATEIARDVNDRRFCLAVRRELRCELPGSGEADWIDDAVSVASAAAAASPQGTWIAKAVHSSAARGRVGGKGTEIDEAHRRGIEKLIEVHGAVIIEPWVQRTGDFGAAAFVDAAGVRDVTLHDLVSNARGDFRGITIPSSLRPDEAARLTEVATGVGEALRARGYVGPFGIDAFRWKDAAGAEHFHPLCEINARWTFGRIARELAMRLSGKRDAIRLRVGDSADLAAAREKHGAAHVRVLLEPAPPDDAAAWLV